MVMKKVKQIDRTFKKSSTKRSDFVANGLKPV